MLLQKLKLPIAVAYDFEVCIHKDSVHSDEHLTVEIVKIYILDD